MVPITAIFENGLFRPTVPVDLPEGTRLQCTPDPPLPENDEELSPEELADLAAIYEILSHRYDSGDTYASSRIDEHQP